MDKPKTDYDSPWKEAIGQYFEDFLRFFFPEINEDIEWACGYDLLDTELQGISREADNKRREADMLLQVTRRSGDQQLVLVHVEVQSQVDPEFTRRMLLYHSRIADKFGQAVCSLAILGDHNLSWRPVLHRNFLWGCSHELHFPVRKLLDYPDWANDSLNPFSWITAAHLQAQATRAQPGKRAEIKFRLVRGLYECGLSRSKILQFFRLVDWILSLPPETEYSFKKELARYEKEHRMVYITSIERILREEAREEAWEEARKVAREEARKEVREEARKEVLEQGLEQGRLLAKREDCQKLRTAIHEHSAKAWGGLDAEASDRLEEIDDLMRLVDLMVKAVNSPSLADWKVLLA